MKNPQAGCLYCRKPAEILSINVLHNTTVVNIQVSPTAELPIQPRERLIYKIAVSSICFASIFGVIIAEITGKFS